MSEQSDDGSSTAYTVRIEHDEGVEHIAHVFDQRVRQVHGITAILGAEAGMADVEVTVVLTPDFRTRVDGILLAAAERDGRIHQPFGVERISGIAVAKNLPTNDTGSEVSIVIDAGAMRFDSAQADIYSTFLIAHELFHPVLNRTRDASGVLDGVTFPSSTAAELARSIVRIASDEYRADRLAHSLIELGLSPTGHDGRKLSPAEYFPAGYGDSLDAAASEAVHPGWADLVDAYRNWRIPLNDMWSTIVRQTDQVVTAAAHAQAERDVMALEVPVFSGTSARARSLYLDPMWEPIRNLLDEQEILPTAHELRQSEPALLEAGQRSIHEMWGKLGLTFRDLGNRAFHIDVGQPMR